jgi:hypothetical protein
VSSVFIVQISCDRQRKSQPRPEGRAAQTQGQQHRDIVSGPAVPAAASGNIRSICRASQRARSGVGAGRAAQHGPVLLCNAAANIAIARARTGVAFGQAVLERQPRNGFGESARTRTENSAVAGLHHQFRQLIHPTTAWNLKNAFTESGAARAGPWIEFCSAVRNVG